MDPNSLSSLSRCLILVVYFCFLKDIMAETSMEDELSFQKPNDEASEVENRLNSFNNFYPLDHELSYKRSSSFFPLRGKKTQEEEYTQDLYNTLDEDEEGKRSHFFPLRGKKLVEELKRASAFMPMRGRKADSWKEEDDLAKRASSFMPMRGKKKTLDARSRLGRIEKNGMYPHDISEVEISRSTPPSDDEHVQKRSAFMPMRGRRDSAPETSPGHIATRLLEKKEDPQKPRDKRASAFMPMRGRKADQEVLSLPEEDLIWDNDNLWSLEEKKSSFMPMRGRRFFNGSWSDFDDSDVDDGPHPAPKRYYNPYRYLLSGMGSSLIRRPLGNLMLYDPFVPRETRLKINWDSVKRAFHATRGKRMLDEDLEEEILPRRSIRSKRTVVNPRVVMAKLFPYIALKRPMSFFATRGKRMDVATSDEIHQMR